MRPAEVVQRQVDAYNARDLVRFAACYAESIAIFRMPSVTPSIAGKSQLEATYRNRFGAPQLHADILARVVLGNKVVDHERVRGIEAQPIEAVAIYEVEAELIRTVWFFFPHDAAAGPGSS